MNLKLADDERELLTAELAQALPQVRNPETQAAYADLLTAAEQGEVPAELLSPLETLLEVGLESGRIRKVHSAHGEMAALRLYQRTPRGASVRESTELVNAALRGVQGQSIEELLVSPSGPGAYTI